MRGKNLSKNYTSDTVVYDLRPYQWHVSYYRIHSKLQLFSHIIFNDKERIYHELLSE